MRSFALLFVAVAATCTTVTMTRDSHARLFWQTYGSTVATPSGCAWNLNSDYFVPRHCDSCRYDLFSPCKKSHTASPACKNLHPVHEGCCTPYGSCHFKFRDHLYKKHCGCTPLKCQYGSWHLEKCRKHKCVLRPGAETGDRHCARGCRADVATDCVSGGEIVNYGDFADGVTLPNIEPLGGEKLGTIAAIPAGMMGGGGMPAAMPSLSAGQSMPAMTGAPQAAGGAAFSLPALFGQ